MELKILSNLKEIPRQDWNALAMGDFPFAEYDYLSAMESGGCVGAEAGWIPRYLTLWEKERLLGATYLYIKDNSQGEFIFDWEWARAYARHGISYFPKLLSASPFTPVTGPKLLLHPDAKAAEIAPRLIVAARELCQAEGCSGLHFLYLTEEEVPWFEKAGALIRHSYQFRWRNQGYRDFTEFLNSLRRKRRLQIARERRRVAELPLEIVTLSGTEIRPEDLAAMIDFYQTTFIKKYCSPYLTPRFFQEIYERMRDQLVLIMARSGKEWVAGSINYRKGACLYGRYWGATVEYPNLHFDLCYYQTVEYAIRHGLQEVDAGAGMPHKIFRGFRPELVYSAHWIEHPAFRPAIAEYIEQEKELIRSELEYAQEHDSFQKFKDEETPL
ncbi:MAG TPA: GNAT family N-acetyltransferase [Deltaproteobacteria bacterium]|nr:GNAT family N-acetyltransferase [Deltaproteobacteria bacterium]